MEFTKPPFAVRSPPTESVPESVSPVQVRVVHVRVPVSASPVHVMFCRLVVPWTVRFWVVVFPEPSTKKGKVLPL